nr:hypothetical protein [Escherichia coli]
MPLCKKISGRHDADCRKPQQFAGFSLFNSKNYGPLMLLAFLRPRPQASRKGDSK